MDVEKQRIKEQEDRRVTQQEMRMREDMESRMRHQEMEARSSQPAVIVQTVAQSQRDVEDDWFIYFDVSPKQTGVSSIYLFIDKCKLLTLM